MITGTVYLILNTITNTPYVGRTIDRKERHRQHFGRLKRGVHHNQHLQRSYNKYGRKAFTFEILEDDIPEDRLSERELFWIDFYDAYENGFNQSDTQGSAADGSPCHWNGVEYRSVSAAARAIGIDASNMLRRIQKGYTCDSDMPSKQIITWNGVEFDTVLEAAQANGIVYETMAWRIRQGYTRDSDVPIGGYSKPVMWNGVEYPSIKVAAHDLGITSPSMRYRIERGYTCDDDLYSCLVDMYDAKSAAKTIIRNMDKELLYELIERLNAWVNED